MPHLALPARGAASALLLALCCLALPGCAVITLGGAAIGAAGIAVDATIGAAKLTGKAVGAAADLVIPDSDEEP
jgi:hypothetical protein